MAHISYLSMLKRIDVISSLNIRKKDAFQSPLEYPIMHSCVTNVPLPTSITVYVAYMLSYELMSHCEDIDSDETGAIEELYSRSMAMLY